MKTILISCLLLMISLSAYPAIAQENTLAPLIKESLPGKQEWFWGVSYLRWSESLRLQRTTFIGHDTANFAGWNLNLERQIVYPSWGWSAGVSFGSGRASGGGNSSVVTYQRNNEAWTSFGATAKIFHRLTPRISVGAAVPLILRNISWLNPDGLTEVSSGQNFNLGLLFDLVIRVDKKTDFYQEIGTLNSQGSTLWRVGLNFRF